MSDQCDNCGTPLEGPFCGACGQSVGTLDVPVRDFARDFASEALGLDSRVRMTMWPLVRYPGRVATEYVSGHRARFVPPIRLYLLSSFLMFVVLSFGQFEIENVEVDGQRVGRAAFVSAPDSSAPVDTITAESDTTSTDRGGVIQADLGSEELNARLSVGVQRMMADPREATRVFIDQLAKAMIVLLPVFALLLKLMWWKRWYVHHMVFAMYLHSFAFFVIALASLPEVMGLTAVGRVTEPLILLIPIHYFLALRRFYGKRWSLYPKGAFVLVTYTLMTSIAVVVLLFTSLLSL